MQAPADAAAVAAPAPASAQEPAAVKPVAENASAPVAAEAAPAPPLTAETPEETVSTTLPSADAANTESATEAAAPASSGSASESAVVPAEVDPATVDEHAHPKISKTKMLEIVTAVKDAAQSLCDDIKAQVASGQLQQSSAPMFVQMRIEALDQQIGARFGVSKQDIESAQSVYESDPAVVPLVAEIQEITQLAMMGGTKPEPTWDEETMIQRVRENADATLDILLERKQEVVAMNMPAEQAKQAFQQMMMQILPQVAMMAMERIGVNAEEMQANMLAYSSNERVMKAVMDASQTLESGKMEELMTFN